MRRTIALALLLLAFAAERGRAPSDLPARSDRVDSYTIRARLDPALKEIRGEMDLVWRNATSKPVDFIDWSKLYLVGKSGWQGREMVIPRYKGMHNVVGVTFDWKLTRSTAPATPPWARSISLRPCRSNNKENQQAWTGRGGQLRPVRLFPSGSSAT